MERINLIYALSGAAPVANADSGRGGRWQGAEVQLKKLRFVSVCVRTVGTPSEGLEELRDRGARPWPELKTAIELRRTFDDEWPREEQLLAASQSDPE